MYPWPITNESIKFSLNSAASAADGANCADTTASTGTVYCVTATSNGALYKSNHGTPSSCTADTSQNGDILFASDGTSVVAFTAANASGFLYSCTNGTNCNQIKAAGYYLTKGTKRYLMNCVDSTGVCTKVTQEGYYLPSTADTTNKLYYCNKSGTCSVPATINVGFYLNGDGYSSGYTKLIQCTSSTTCDDYTGRITNGSFFGNGEEATTAQSKVTYTKLIKCTESGSLTCETHAVKAAGVYLDGAMTTNIIKCAKKNDCSIEAGSTDNGKGYLDAGTTGNVIVCATACLSLASGNAQAADAGGVAFNTGFLDAATDGNLIICTNSACTTNTVTGAQGQALLDGKSYDTTNTKFTKLIKWKSGSTWEYVGSPDQTGAYIDAGSCTGTGNRRVCPNVITYDTTNAKFVVAAGSVTTDAVAYMDATDPTKIIKCSGTACTSGANGAPSYYIDGVDKKNIIKCTAADADCTSSAGSESTTTLFYLDSLNEGVIKCASGNDCAKEGNVDSADGKGYLDAGSENANVIVCGSDNKCQSLPDGNAQAAPEDGIAQNTGFLDAATSGNLIICVKETGCTTAAVTGATGQAILDGKSYTTTTKFSKLIKYNGSGWEFVSTPSQTEAYIDAGSCDGTTCPNVIVYDASNKLMVQEGSDKSDDDGSDTTTTKFYLDTTNAGNVLKCDKGADCVTEEATGGVEQKTGLLDAGVEGNLIICTNGVKCVSAAVAGAQGQALLAGTTYDSTASGCSSLIMWKTGTTWEFADSASETEAYIDAGTCDGTGSSQKCKNIVRFDDTNSIYQVVSGALKTTGVAYIDATDKTKVILCDAEKCSSNDNGASTTTSTYYIDGIVDTNIIKCTASDAECTSDEGSDTTTTLFYLDSLNEGIFKCAQGAVCAQEAANDIVKDDGKGYLDAGSENANVIVCGSDNKCQSLPDGNAQAATEDGVAQNTGFLDATGTSGELIICVKGTGCTSDTVTGVDGQAILDGKSYTAETGFTHVIENNSGWNLATTTPLAGEAYIDVGSSPDGSAFPNIITYADSKYTVIPGESTIGYAYIDPITKTNIIKCDESTCASDASGGTDSLTMNFIDGLDPQKIISCNDTGCTSDDTGVSENENKYYVDGTTPANIIKCTAAAGCASDVGSVTEGEGYLDGNSSTKVIVCTEADGCVSGDGANATDEIDTYIDADNTTKLIYCEGEDDAMACEYITSAPGATYAEYYPRFAEGAKEVIKCVNTEDKCTLVAEDDLTANTVYINALFKETTTATGDHEHPLLVCDDSKECAPYTPELTAEAAEADEDEGDEATRRKRDAAAATYRPNYYVNGDDVNTAQKIIKCTAADKSCTTIAGEEKSVYLNANPNTNTDKPIIVCQEGECTETDPESSAEAMKYYLNAGTASAKDAVIECAAECDVLPAKQDKTYINAVDASQLIMCTDTACHLKTSEKGVVVVG
ncbi:hypothetical protein PIROE2DRAFT_60828 [Piromyces sp. E2]|nr:hypothetical protein PIROE2DRAFT_60828 [Piromyces sp. E2]|eukprot:OUM64198.1 hypothetical protein PIROE2DRAFT_60828 [Piromyces sp. E2]